MKSIKNILLIAAILFSTGAWLTGCGLTPDGHEQDPSGTAYTLHSEWVTTHFTDVPQDFQTHLLVAENIQAADGMILFFIHGFCHTGNFYKPLMDNIFNWFGDRIFRIYAIDLPGHGKSGYPADYVMYGFMTLENYVQTSIQVLKEIEYSYGHVDLIGGHSMGGMVVQKIQQTLLDQGKTLRDEVGTNNILLLASASPAQVPASPSGIIDFYTYTLGLVPLMFSGLKLDLERGLYYDFSNDIFLNSFFSNMEGQVVDGAPQTAAEFEALKSRDAFIASMQTSILRPAIQWGAFENYHLATVAYEEDLFYKMTWESELHPYLLGKSGTETKEVEGFFPIMGSQAIHEGPYSMPESIENPMRYLFAED